ncbi:sulfite exporter TauE/SafE family protein [Roseovarius sp. ZX-A-9]|uniref:sulfite exporter TauE/SafE family protein n=1 Tax=Roseovarius sp. ZX-A-9 TaxID=3014783 RepID=UPI00232E659B|nr:sulfite exporter TauE/SafE family protein [Roseovarius sp. ZX-A-9]
MFDLIVLILAGFGAGALNTIAGGGTFLTLPALIFTGVPPVAANATSAVAVFPGYASGALGFLPEMRAFDRALLIRLTLVTLAGALLGSLLLLVSSDAAFSVVVPVLLLGATLVFLFGGPIRAWAAAKSRSVTPYGSAGLFAVSVYGGYFNGGLGIVLLALFSLWGMSNLHQMNGLKNGLSFALSGISVATFAVAGLVEWHQAIVMMIASTAGGYAGAPLARIIPMPVLRGLIAAIGFGMSAVFFARLF